MDPYKETFETWNKVAALYEEMFMQLDMYNESYNFFCNGITHVNAAILEIGCGPGNITKYLLAKRPGFSVFGIDIAPNMIALAKKNNPSARFAVMDCRHIDSLTEKYQGIVAGFCIPYLSGAETEQLFIASRHLLENGGLLYLSFVKGSPDQSGFKTGSSGDRTYFYYHDLDTISKQLAAQQFTVLKIYEVNYVRSATEQELHTVIIAVKNNML